MVPLRCTVRLGIVTLKGGPGSGHRGHAGRPGSVGGSVPGTSGAGSTNSKWSDNAPFAAAKLNLTPPDIENMFTLPGTKLELDVYDTYFPSNGITVEGVWHTSDGKYVGEFARIFYTDKSGKLVAENSELMFSGDFQNSGLAKSLYDRQIGQLRKAGFDRIELSADVSIGRYAWAKKGFGYKDDARELKATTDFKRWACWRWAVGKARKSIGKPSSGWPTFKSAYDVATYNIPGISVLGSQIDNYDVPGDMKMSVGKAFMLDKHPQGHDSWEAVLHLQK